MSGPSLGRRAEPSAILRRLMYERFAMFMSQLRDERGVPLEVPAHIELWCRLVEQTPRLVLLAPRAHAKSTLQLASILWRFYRHGIEVRSAGRRPNRGTCSVVLFSATHAQAAVLMDRFRGLLAANPDLFDDPVVRRSDGHRVRSQNHIRLASGAELRTRAWGTSTRGLHPDLLVLDDVLNDQNSGTDQARRQTWAYFTATILPMHAGRMFLAGTSFHPDDLLHRLGERPPGAPTAGLFGFVTRVDASLRDDGSSLWPEHHPPAELMVIRDLEPVMFAREYQNDPHVEAASLFPRSLSDRAVEAGRELTLVRSYRARSGELVVFGADVARGAGASADFTVMMVVAWDLENETRRLLAVERAKGLQLAEHIDRIRYLCRSFGVDLGVVEDNAFQAWLIEELRKDPATRMISGATTTHGSKTDAVAGVPGIRLALERDHWIIPSGDEPSRGFARIWQAELAAFGWRDGKLRGTAEHDDTVMATWFVEQAIARIGALIRQLPRVEIVTMEDLGIERVRIGDWDHGW